jgi:hypothetical protein
MRPASLPGRPTPHASAIPPARRNRGGRVRLDAVRRRMGPRGRWLLSDLPAAPQHPPASVLEMRAHRAARCIRLRMRGRFIDRAMLGDDMHQPRAHRTLRIEARRCRLRKGDERRMQRIAGRGCNGRWKPRSSSTEPHGCPQAAARHGAALPGRLPRSSPHTRLEQRQQRSGRGRTAGRTRRRHPDPAAFGPRRPPSAGTWPRPPRCADAEASRHGIGRRQALAGCELAALMRRRHRLRQRSRVDQPG